MKRDRDGLPVVGIRSKELGVRVPPDVHADVDLDETNSVRLNRRGMSVTLHRRFLKPHLVPKRLKQWHPGAAGADSLSIYRYGEGSFEDSAITENLALAVTSAIHGNVVPATLMHLDDFLSHIADTRDKWTIEEPTG